MRLVARISDRRESRLGDEKNERKNSGDMAPATLIQSYTDRSCLCMYVCVYLSKEQKKKKKKNTIGKREEEKKQAYNNKTELIETTTSILYR